jgi:hypothetical protein
MREDFEPQRGDIICVELLGKPPASPSLYLVIKVLKNDPPNFEMKCYCYRYNDLVTGYWDWRKYPDKRRITLVARLTDK